ncbi:MAG: phosphate regulon sensor histidine kinase PhoR [Betaproteobacteria bacterium]|nr:phosphate regulon sensor histidine kinase PhoR [Betaproteobacteria bacterium]
MKPFAEAATAFCLNKGLAVTLVWFRSLAFTALVIIAAAWLYRYLSPAFAFALLGGALVVAVLYQASFVSQLTAWANLPRNRPLPIGWGIWTPLIERLNRFSRQQQASLSELSSELERIHAAVDRLPDGLVLLDRYDHVSWSNQAAQSLHGIFGTQRPVHHFIRQPEFAEMLQRRGGGPQTQLLQLNTQPGRTFELQLHETDAEHRLLITRDITDQAKLDAVRSDFVANVSHEIRTPATVIAGFAETLLSLELDEKSHREYLSAILRQSETMGRLVGDLLLLSSLERATDRMEESPVELQPLLESLIYEARALSAGRHKISLEFDGPARLLAAPAEIESALRNLITNAVRYTPDGGSITVSWRARDDEGWLAVRDTGIGIAAEHMPRITERFYRVDRSRSRDTGGTGLGLAIVKRIANRHHASLRIDSEPGRGSTFTLRFPARRMVADPPVDATPAASLSPQNAPDASPRHPSSEQSSSDV